MRIIDSVRKLLFRESAIPMHPYFQPYLAFNDKPGSPTIYFKSCYDETRFCIKQWGISGFQMNKIHPGLYHWPEKRENKIIVIKQGGYARIPHTFYRAFTTDGCPANYSVRSEVGL